MPDIDWEAVFGRLADGDDGALYIDGAQCKFCKRWGMHWRETADGRRLYENERERPGNRHPAHNCLNNIPNADGFEDLDD